ncbi:thaumatin [Cubamyces lactineus]|nr:thaumatin [Cubamyces lactineus]
MLHLTTSLFSALVLAYFPTPSHARTFTVINQCPFTIWPAMFTDLTAGTAVPDFPTGWEAPPSNSVTFTVPDNWKAGRIWGRRDCDFTTTNGPTCLDGWCNGGLLCDPHTGTGVPPATVAEWTLQGDHQQKCAFVCISMGTYTNVRAESIHRVGKQGYVFRLRRTSRSMHTFVFHCVLPDPLFTFVWQHY